MLPFSSPAPGTAEPDDFERKILRDNLAEWNVIGEPPLIKSGGVSGLSSVISFTPRLGDVDGTKGGEENSGCERDGEPDRLDFRDADEERLLLSSKDLLVKVAVDVSDDEVGTDSANAALSFPVGNAGLTLPYAFRL